MLGFAVLVIDLNGESFGKKLLKVVDGFHKRDIVETAFQMSAYMYEWLIQKVEQFVVSIKIGN